MSPQHAEEKAAFNNALLGTCTWELGSMSSNGREDAGEGHLGRRQMRKQHGPLFSGELWQKPISP